MKNTIKERGTKILEHLGNDSKQTLCALSKQIGISKSSVHRHLQGIARRNQYPESNWWETAIGREWLQRLFVGVIYHFGIKQGVGLESLSRFFKDLHIEHQVGCSASAIGTLKAELEKRIIAYEQTHSGLCQPSAGTAGICVGGDETFFGLPILVLMELSSGYLFTEVQTQNRTYQTWLEQIQQWWSVESGQWQCHFMVSDGAKALIKLANSGFQTQHVADLFHGLRDLGKPIASAIGRARRQQHSQHQQLPAHRSEHGHSQQALSQQQQDLEHSQQIYQQAMEDISATIHPFEIETSQWQLFHPLSVQLKAPLQQLSLLAQQWGGQKANDAILRFERLIPSWSIAIYTWWNWVNLSLDEQTQDVEIQNWALSLLLPWMYWQQQANKTRHKQLKLRYRIAERNAFEVFQRHPLSSHLDADDLMAWRLWAQTLCAKFQRTSSAIEGRNGLLARLHHARRGFSPQSLKVLSIIHNFDTRRPDGSTPAQRLFQHQFPDLFEAILELPTNLPAPRRSSKAQLTKPTH